jgi:hypothetical protein
MSAKAQPAPQKGTFSARPDELYVAEKPPILLQAVDPDNRPVQLVLYRDVAQELLRPRTSIWLRAGLIAPWIVGIFLWFFVLKSVSQQQARDLAQSQSLVALTGSISHQNEQVISLASSLGTLASAVASSSTRTNSIEKDLERSRRDLSRIEAKLRNDEAKLEKKTASDSAVETKLPVKPGHNHRVAAELHPVAGAQVWRDIHGKVVYWLMPRDVLGSVHLVRVIPVATHPVGVVVHDIEDGEDYVVTHSGSWVREDVSGASIDQ